MRKKLFTNRYLWLYFLLILSVIIIGFLPVILHWFHTPKGYYYPYIDNEGNAGDIYYTGAIRFGTGPEWLYKIPQVSVDHQASFVQILFILFGKLCIVTGIGPAEMLVIAKITGAVIFMASSALFVNLIFQKKAAIIAFLIFLFAQPLPLWQDGKTILDQYFYKWTWYFGEAARRAVIVAPHYTIGKGLVIFSLCLLYQYLSKRKKIFLLFALILGFTAGIFYPPPVFIMALSFSFGAFLYLIFHRFNLRIFFGGKYTAITVFIITLLIPLLLLKLELGKGYPWIMWTIMELGWNNPYIPFEKEYLFTLGLPVLLLPFAFFALVKRFKAMKENVLNFVIYIWGISAFILFPFAQTLSLGKFRFSEGAQVLPIAVLAFWGFQEFALILRKIAGEKIERIISGLMLFLFILNFAVFTILSARYFTKLNWNYSQNMYFDPSELEALKFVDRNVPVNSIVMAYIDESLFLPAFARVRTIIGAQDLYPKLSDHYHDKVFTDALFKSGLKVVEADKFIRDKKASYVYKRKTGNKEESLYPTLMEKIFSNAKVDIYKIREKGRGK
jgi:hypothetical protein